MSRQPLVSTGAAEASGPPDGSRGDGAPDAPAPAAAASVPADVAQTGSRAALSSVEPPAAVGVPATGSFTSELPPSLRARTAGFGVADFSTEPEIRFKTHPPLARTGPSPIVIATAAGALIGVAALTYATVFRRPPAPVAVAAMGEAQVDSRPGGADVVIDGTPRGRTPVKLSLPVGAHTLEIRTESGSRTLPLVIEAGVLVSQHVELAAPPPALATTDTGRLDVSSDPPGAQVRVDGVTRGVTPLTLEAVGAREHRIALSRDGATIYRNVRVAPGATASVVASFAVPVATTGTVGGFLSLVLPFEAQVLEDGKLLGSSRSERLMLPTGRHDLELVNAALQFRSTLSVSIEAGKVAAPTVVIPDGRLSVNALPWAEVFIDGRSVGTTPLANLAIPIGTHDVVWRHPQLGERRQPVTITTQALARAGVTFSP